mgnify:CR=1 FL=1
MNRVHITAVSAGGVNLGNEVPQAAAVLAQYSGGDLLLAGGADQATVHIGGKVASVKGDGLDVVWLARVHPKVAK